MNRPLAFLILLILFPVLYLAFTLSARIDDTVELRAVSTSSDRLPANFSAFVAGLHDRTPPNYVTTTTSPRAKARTAPIVQSTPPWDGWTWDELADCESGEWDRNRVPIPGSANWASTENGFEGGVHFAPSTWDGFRDPDMPDGAHLASREVQIVVAERVLARQGPGAWPVCSYKVGMR